MGRRGASEPIRDRQPDALGGWRHREHDVESENIGLSERRVEDAGVLVRVVRCGQRHGPRWQLAAPISRPASTPTCSPAPSSARRAVRERRRRRRPRRGRAARSATRACPARGSCRRPAAPTPSERAELLAGDAAEPQHARRVRGAVDDRRLDTDRARAAVEHERNRRRRARRAPRRRSSGSPGRSGWPTARRARRRTRRAAPARAGGPGPGARRCRARRSPRRERAASRRTTSVSGPGQHAAASVARRGRDLDRPVVELLGAREVHDDRMLGRSTLHRVEAAQRVAVRRVGAEAVHRLGRERDQSAVAQDRDRARDASGRLTSS